MLPGHTHTPAQIIGELLDGHPEAASLLGEACHCQALARESAAREGQAFAAAQAARLAYEELRHRLDPRRRRTVGFGVGSLILALLGAALTLLDTMQLRVSVGGTGSVLLALVAAVVWLTGAWIAALAVQERRRPTLLAATTAAIALSLLLAALHGSGHPNMLVGLVVSTSILALSAGGAVLMTRMESASVFMARRRWRAARAAHAAAVRTQRNDAEMATVATEAWLTLVRTRASMLADEGELVHETLTLASELLHGSQRQLLSQDNPAN